MERTRDSDARAVGWTAGLGLAGAGLVTAFVIAPAALLRPRYGEYQGEGRLAGALARSLVEFWRGGGPALPGQLQELVSYWFAWHAIKVVITALMAVVFGLLAARLWRGYTASGGGARYAGALAATVATVAALFLLAVNIQATAVPLMALLPLVPEGAGQPGLAAVLAEMHRGLTDPTGPYAAVAALDVLRGDVARYHGVLAGVSGILALAGPMAGAVLWRRRSPGGGDARRTRRAGITLTVLIAVGAAGFLLLAVAGTVSALDPSAALIGQLGLG